MWILKTDLLGNLEWSKKFGGLYSEQAEDAILTKEGNFAIIASTFGYGSGNQEIWFLEIDREGNVLQNHTYGGTHIEELKTIIQTKNGGYAIAAYTYSFGSGPPDFFFLNLLPNGTIVYNNTFGGSDYDQAWGICELNTGEFVLAGYTGYHFEGNDFLIVKTDSMVTMIWNLTLGGDIYEEARDVIATSDGEF